MMFVNPGLPEKYKEHTKLHIVKCNDCKREFATTMKIPRCGRCRKYLKEAKKK